MAQNPSTLLTSTIYISSDWTSRTIRVLNLQAARHDDDELVGSLQTISLDDNIPYFALSYVWGDYSTNPDTININNTRLNITSNCREALVEIRHRHGSVCLWVDSLCIDQANQQEQAHQIALMREIYSRAETVLVWLGAESPECNQAMRWISKSSRFAFFGLCPRVSINTGQIFSSLLLKLPQNLAWCIQCRLRRIFRKLDLFT
jgi:Heterokaryon incompatibility protein (HET)